MLRRVDLVFPAPNKPLSINEANRMHWAAKRRRLEPWREATQLAWLAARDEHHLIKDKRCTVELHVPFLDRRRRDPHNYVVLLKAIIDSLVRQTAVDPVGTTHIVWDGCWLDDNPEWVHTLEPVLYEGTDCIVRITPDE